MIARTRKGQFAVIEQVVLFALGIAVLSGFLTIFEGFGTDVKGDALEEQSRMVSDVVGSHVVRLISTDADGDLTFTLPDSIAGEDYRINFTEEGVSVLLQDHSHLSPVYGLTQSYTLEGSVSNEFQTAVISKEQSTITIGSP